MDKKRLKQSCKKSAKGLWNTFPVLVGVILLISLLNSLLANIGYSSFFNKNIVSNSILSGFLGSIFAGNPITSYIIAGKFLKANINIIPITVFVVCWVTVGIVQLPAEIILLGKKFAIWRNLTAFLFSFVVAIITFIGVSIL